MDAGLTESALKVYLVESWCMFAVDWPFLNLLQSIVVVVPLWCSHSAWCFDDVCAYCSRLLKYSYV